MGRIFVAVAMLLFAALGAAAQEAARPFIVTGYVLPRNGLLAPDQIDARDLTRINYAFAAIQNGRLATGSKMDAENLALLAGLRKQNPRLTVLVSVGGWLGSGSFSDVALTAESRKTFADSAVDLLRRYDLDGLDVDWEYPGMPGAGHACRPEDKHNFTLLLRDLRARFDQEEKMAGRKLLLTIAAGASGDYLAHTEMKEVQRYVDSIDLMTYDYAQATGKSVTGHNAPLFADPAAPSPLSVDDSLRALESAGVPAGKILLGVPFYGYLWTHVADRNHGLFQPGKIAPGDFVPYRAIAQTMFGHGFARYWDKASQAAYLYNAQRREFVSYDDAESVAAKCAYVRMHKLGGAVVWQSLDDSPGGLLAVIDRALAPPLKNAR